MLYFQQVHNKFREHWFQLLTSLIFANFSILCWHSITLWTYRTTCNLEKEENYFTRCRTLVNLVFISRKLHAATSLLLLPVLVSKSFLRSKFFLLGTVCDTIGIRKRSSKNRRTFYNSLQDKRYSHGVHRAQLSTQEEIWKTALEKRIDPPITINASHFCIS